MGKKSRQKKQQQQQKHLQTRPMATSPVMGTPVAATASRATGLELGEQYIRQDISKVLILLGVVAVVLVALLIVNDKSTALFQAGRSLASFMRLAS